MAVPLDTIEYTPHVRVNPSVELAVSGPDHLLVQLSLQAPLELSIAPTNTNNSKLVLSEERLAESSCRNAFLDHVVLFYPHHGLLLLRFTETL